MKKEKRMQKKRTYVEIFEDIERAKYGKECRILHKELKKAGYGSLPMYMRYPNLPDIISCIALVVAIVMSAISILRLL